MNWITMKYGLYDELKDVSYNSDQDTIDTVTNHSNLTPKA